MPQLHSHRFLTAGFKIHWRDMFVSMALRFLVNDSFSLELLFSELQDYYLVNSEKEAKNVISSERILFIICPSRLMFITV